VEPAELTVAEFRVFQELIYQNSGIRFPKMKRYLLSNRIRRRLKANGITTFQEYLALLNSFRGGVEMTSFLDVITTNETFFFRTQPHFDWFRCEFLPEMLSLVRSVGHSKRIRVWSAACSTGEEPYSLAICLAEKAWTLRSVNLHILGTDISEDALDKAREAVFNERDLKLISHSQLRRFFQKQKDASGWRLRETIRELVEFRKHNLMRRLAVPPFDCIFIRNVLIYFDRESKQTVVHHLIQSLAVGGYLVVGPSEGIHDLLGELKQCKTFLYQKTH